MTARELRDVIETAFAAGHAAGVVDASDERDADVPIGDMRAQWGKEIDDLVYEAKRKLEVKP
jgi:hypothetical protein